MDEHLVTALFVELPKFLSFKAMGLGLALAVLSAVLVLFKVKPLFFATFMGFCLAIFAAGVYLELVKYPIPGAGSCVKADGSSGTVTVTISVYNRDGTPHGYHKASIKPSGSPLVSDIVWDQITSSDKLTKKYAGRWDCV